MTANEFLIIYCPICGRNCFKTITLFDDRYGFPGYFNLLECHGCGHKVLEGDFSQGFLSKLYTNYYPRSTFKLEDYKPYEEVSGLKAWFNGEYSSAYRWVPRNVRVLDIGCGFGESLGYHESRGCDAYGVEVDENIRRVADKFGYKVHVGHFAPDLYQPDYFDYVTMAQVIEHVTDPITTLKGVARIIKPGGVVILTTPNSKGWGAMIFGRKWINWHVPYHIQHFSINSMELAATKAGLIIKLQKTISPSEWLFYQWIHLVTYPKPGKPSLFWSHKRQFPFIKELFLGVILLFHKLKINHVITRFFDAINLGDNFVFVLYKPE